MKSAATVMPAKVPIRMRSPQMSRPRPLAPILWTQSCPPAESLRASDAPDSSAKSSPDDIGSGSPVRSGARQPQTRKNLLHFPPPSIFGEIRVRPTWSTTRSAPAAKYSPGHLAVRTWRIHPQILVYRISRRRRSRTVRSGIPPEKMGLWTVPVACTPGPPASGESIGKRTERGGRRPGRLRIGTLRAAEGCSDHEAGRTSP